MGPFAYVPFIIIFLKFNDAAYDTRQSMHKTMGVLTYIYIVVNMAMGGNIWLADLGVFLFASFFFYRAMSENFEHLSVAGLVTMLAFGALCVWIEMPGEPAPADSKQAAAESAMEKELRKTLENAQKAIQAQQQAPADLLK